jgi:hypothetical protein
MFFRLALYLMLFFGQSGGTNVPPLNSTAAVTGCASFSACTYTDVNVPPGAHFYFVVGTNVTGYSGPSNAVYLTIPSGSHNVVLNWNPSSSTDFSIGYWIYRGSPPTNVTISGSH